MRTIQWLKQPAYLTDLVFTFVLYYNRDQISKFINFSKPNDDMDFYKKVLSDFVPFPDELLLFFYLTGSGASFITSEYLVKSGVQLAQGYEFDFFLEKLSNQQLLVRNLFSFYFSSVPSMHRGSYLSSLPQLSDLIRSSAYPDNVKFLLQAFFIQPQLFLDKLLSELERKESILARYYQESQRQLAALKQELALDGLFQKLLEARILDSPLPENTEIDLSVSLIHKNAAYAFGSAKAVLLVLGCDYDAYLDFLILQRTKPDLVVLGKILADKTRIAILQLLYCHKEVSTGEIAKKMNMSMTAVYYHLEMMAQSSLLYCRAEGRTVYYSLNRRYLNLAAEMIRGMTEEEQQGPPVPQAGGSQSQS